MALALRRPTGSASKPGARGQAAACCAASGSATTSKASAAQPTEQATVKVTPEGRIQLIVGTFSHARPRDRVRADRLPETRRGLRHDRLLQGDTAFVTNGNVPAARARRRWRRRQRARQHQVIAKARRLAAHALEAAEADIAHRNGGFEVAGTDLRSRSQIAQLAQDPKKLPRARRPGLDETCLYHARPSAISQWRAYRRSRDRPGHRHLTVANTPASTIAA